MTVDPPRGSSLAQEATAQIQLGLFGTVGTLARQLRLADQLAPVLRQGGLVRPLTIDRSQRRVAAGLAAASRAMPAFGGILYAVGALEQTVTLEGATIVRTDQDSRLDVGDMTLLEADRRLEWRRYACVYELLEARFATGGPLPELIVLDVPLVMGRAVYAQVLEDEQLENRSLKDELDRLRHRVDAFWAAYGDACFPYAPNGPRVVSLDRRRFGSLLRLVESQGQAVSPDPLSSAAVDLVQQRWTEVLSVGIDRLLAGILQGNSRTAAFDYDVARLDRRAFPQTLIERGMLGFHYRAGLRGEPLQVQTLGAATVWRERGGAEAIDALAADLAALTLFDRKDAVPLPLWYAREGVQVVRDDKLLRFYKQETLRAMQAQRVEQTWLAHWDGE